MMKRERTKKKMLGLGWVLVLVLSFSPGVVLADGFSVDNGSGSLGAPNVPGKEWPPAGTQPKGGFVAGAFAGVWYAFVDNTAFTLVIEQDGHVLKAAHTAVYDYGRRVDSSVGGVSIAGRVLGSVAYLEWKSGLSNEAGQATIEYLGGRPATLHWKIVNAPKKTEEKTDSLDPAAAEVAYFLPASAFLIRK